MRVIGFNAGQFGDAIMGLVAARAHKEQFPGSKITFAVAKKYAAILPLVANNPLIDGTHVWTGYDDWPQTDDNIHISIARYDKVYNPMPQHTNPFWYLSTHQTAELCAMHGLKAPSNLKIDLVHNWTLYKAPNTIALSLFGETRGGAKSLEWHEASKLAQRIRDMGYIPLQLGLPTEQSYCERFIGTFEESVKCMLECRMLITVDTAMAWIASGYSKPTVGLYGYSYYPMAKTSANWQPKNPNGICLESYRAGDVTLDRIEDAIKKLL